MKRLASFSIYFTALFFLFSFLTGSNLFGISEDHYQEDYQQKIIPFVEKYEKPFSFPSADGKYQLSGVKFIHSHPKGVILFLEGFCQTWKRYEELFYDLYQQGYSVYAYDYRGQGLSPHLSHYSPKIEHINYFSDYVDDLTIFIQRNLVPENPHIPLFILAHDLGATIAADYLENHPGQFQKVIFTSPSFKIKLEPFSESSLYSLELADAKLRNNEKRPMLLTISKWLNSYAINTPQTYSKERAKIGAQFEKEHPNDSIDDPSINWVLEVIAASSKIRKKTDQIHQPLLMLEPEHNPDSSNKSAEKALHKMPHAKIDKIEHSQHEILLESDSIRDKALKKVDDFFSSSP